MDYIEQLHKNLAFKTFTAGIILAVIFTPIFLLLGSNSIFLYDNNKSDNINNKNIYIAESHGPISISGNSELNNSEDVSGSGTREDPYIIEGYEIDASSANGIEIINTDAYLVIQNCTIENGMGNSNNGIYLDNCTKVNISNNILFNNSHGIFLNSSSDNNTITSNTCSNNNNNGIYFYSSSDNTISGNNCTNNNWHGIQLLLNCSNNTISDNLCSENIHGIELNTLSNNNTISNNLCSDNTHGIGLWNSSFNSLLDNDCCNNSDMGVTLTGSSNNTVSENLCSENKMGISLYNLSNYNQILKNTCSNNTRHNIAVNPNCDFNLLFLNYLINSNTNANDYGTDNQWDNGTIGNYWDNYCGSDLDNDGIGDSPHVIAGPPGSQSQDRYPIWDDGPTINVINPTLNKTFGGSPPSFTVQFSDPQLDTMWYSINNSHSIIFTSNGSINEAIWNSLSDGFITLTFYANDTAGNIASTSITIRKDTSKPNITPVILLISIILGICGIIGGASGLILYSYKRKKKKEEELKKIKKKLKKKLPLAQSEDQLKEIRTQTMEYALDEIMEVVDEKLNQLLQNKLEETSKENLIYEILKKGEEYKIEGLKNAAIKKLKDIQKEKLRTSITEAEIKEIIEKAEEYGFNDIIKACKKNIKEIQTRKLDAAETEAEIKEISQKAEAYGFKKIIQSANEKILHLRKRDIKNAVLDLGTKFSRLQISDIVESVNADAKLITKTVKEMIKNDEIHAKYFKGSQSIAFNQQANINEIDELMETYKDWEESKFGKRPSKGSEDMQVNKGTHYPIKTIPFESFDHRKSSEPFIFTSYAHDDGKEVYKQIEYLHNEGFNIWYDEGIPASSDWTEEIAIAIKKCSFFIVFISQNALNSEMVLNEINFALNHHKSVILIFLEDVDLPEGLKLRVNRKQYINKFELKQSYFRKKLCKGLEEVKGS